MGPGTYLLSVAGACAIRLLLGVDAGADFDTTAMSTETDERQRPMRRNPWALRIRPDIYLAVTGNRHMFYAEGAGAFVQPVLDTFEASGMVRAAGRFSLGRRRAVTLEPGVFFRGNSSNELLRSNEAAALAQAEGFDSGVFYALSTGGFLQVDWPVARRFRIMARGEIEGWLQDPIPPPLRGLQPTLSARAAVGFLLALTRRDGIALQGQYDDAMFISDDADTVHQTGITTMIAYRRFWLPYLMTDLSVGAVVNRPRGATDWEPNLAAGFTLLMAGRPQWLTINLNYTRSFEQRAFQSAGDVQDRVNLLFAFGPFADVRFSVGLLWNRYTAEIAHRDENNPAIYTCPFNTIGMTLDVDYLWEQNGFGVGPFFEAFVFTQFAEPDPYNDDYGFLPPLYDPVEAVLMLGVRIQWGMDTGEVPRSAAGGASAGGTRGERRTALRRLDRVERRDSAHAYGMRTYNTTPADEEELFGTNSPLGMGRVGAAYEEEDEDTEEEPEEQERPYWQEPDEPEEVPAPEEEPPVDEMEGLEGEGGP